MIASDPSGLTRALEAPGDGRNVDPEVGALAGEGSLQEVGRLGAPSTSHLAARPPGPGDGPSYHGLPVLKRSVWKWMIPAYFFAGGLAGAAGVLGAAARLAGGRRTRDLARRCAWIATSGAAASAVLLIADLGRPARFVNMLRVFRPSSPMNMGTWVLSGFGATAALSLAPEVLPRSRALDSAAAASAVACGVLGLPLVGYTGVLLANTAVPVWQGTRRSLPVLFAFSGAASVADVLQLWRPRGSGAAAARRLGMAATAAELAFAYATEREAARAPRVARPLRAGASGALFRTGRWLAAASLAAGIAAPHRLRSRVRRPGLRDRLHAVAGVLGLAGTVAIRFGIVAAGNASTLDPHATFEPQRAGFGARELREDHARKAMPSLPGLEPTGEVTADRAAGAAEPG
jgi:formate-dependent nitrite reductase membrane component NrfD